LVFLATVTFACSRKKKLLLKKNSNDFTEVLPEIFGRAIAKMGGKKNEKERAMILRNKSFESIQTRTVDSHKTNEIN